MDGKEVGMYRVEVPCGACGRTGKILTGEGNPVECPYCRGDGKRKVKVPHPSHDMTEWRTEARAPAGTLRWYGVRECKACGEEEMDHPAGHFLGCLGYPCKGGGEASDFRPS